jgi:hypothetical protein
MYVFDVLHLCSGSVLFVVKFMFCLSGEWLLRPLVYVRQLYLCRLSVLFLVFTLMPSVLGVKTVICEDKIDLSVYFILYYTSAVVNFTYSILVLFYLHCAKVLVFVLVFLFILMASLPIFFSYCFNNIARYKNVIYLNQDEDVEYHGFIDNKLPPKCDCDFCLTSSLNGANGSYTGSDDVNFVKGGVAKSSGIDAGLKQINVNYTVNTYNPVGKTSKPVGKLPKLPNPSFILSDKHLAYIQRVAKRAAKADADAELELSNPEVCTSFPTSENVEELSSETAITLVNVVELSSETAIVSRGGSGVTPSDLKSVDTWRSSVPDKDEDLLEYDAEALYMFSRQSCRIYQRYYRDTRYKLDSIDRALIGTETVSATTLVATPFIPLHVLGVHAAILLPHVAASIFLVGAALSGVKLAMVVLEPVKRFNELLNGIPSELPLRRNITSRGRVTRDTHFQGSQFLGYRKTCYIEELYNHLYLARMSGNPYARDFHKWCRQTALSLDTIPAAITDGRVLECEIEDTIAFFIQEMVKREETAADNRIILDRGGLSELLLN